MYTDQDIEAGITALADGVQNRAVQVRYIFEMFRTNLAALVIPNGAHFLFGPSVPTAALGVDGDVYDNTVTGDRSQKQGGAWVFQYRAKGDAGRTPQKGVDYTDGHTPQKGVDYRDGVDGQSAYQLWLGAGNTGSLAVFLASLKSQAVAPANVGSGSYWHQEVYDPATTDGADGEFWQTAVSLSTEKRWKRIAGAWRKFYDNTGVAITPPTTDTTPPSVAFTFPAAGATLTAGTQVTLTATASDNAAVQGLSFTNGGTGAALGAGAKNGTSYTLAFTVPSTAGGLSLTATATDTSGNTATATVNVTVQAAAPAQNQLPTANAGSNTTIQPPTSQVALMGSGSDPDGTVAAYAWRQVTGAAVNGMPSSVQNPVVTGLTTAGTYQFGLTVTDNSGGKSPEVFTVVTVQAAAQTNSLAANSSTPS
ncbi:PKD domain-containing protein [Hymenobacter nivis]|uniref:PKD domain-containing protein n=1 Tax=Hymenobacter nivis TaxID=1850093 RepID=A0A2Z3GF15_9BACT|nr:Ig-like domain-containing protein [Hymenobacter nivis]AWM31368.1 hypothetical protein DDQ68_00335 [Hymenobacter nivis]